MQAVVLFHLKELHLPLICSLHNAGIHVFFFFSQVILTSLMLLYVLAMLLRNYWTLWSKLDSQIRLFLLTAFVRQWCLYSPVTKKVDVMLLAPAQFCFLQKLVELVYWPCCSYSLKQHTSQFGWLRELFVLNSFILCTEELLCVPRRCI